MAGSILDLHGRRAIVTGSSRGIGAATVRALAAAGADVVVCFHTRRDDADRVAEEVRALGRRGVVCGADVSTRVGAETIVETAIRELGGVDIFVGNAGIWPPDNVALTDMGDDQWRRTISANLDSVFFTTRSVARVISVGGKIVLVSSTAGQRGEAFHSDYAATKGAVISFTKSLAVELAPRDVTVNCVAPGWVDTEMVEDAIVAGGLAQISASIPLGRIATAEDVAGPILFLCSPLARHVTGEVINVNGGSVLCG